ncbi:MAG: hypothetical protein IJ906_14735 [Oscillospiraceae bacterium]|nr:hypothetical protein [Oscillospiraceae bacterium]
MVIGAQERTQRVVSGFAVLRRLFVGGKPGATRRVLTHSVGHCDYVPDDEHETPGMFYT